MFAALRRIFLVGVIAAAPLGLTIFLFIKVFFWFDSIFQPWIQVLLVRLNITTPIPGLGIVVGLLTIFLVGLVAPSLLGRQILLGLERLVEQVPLVKLVYSGAKQIFDAFSKSKTQKFNRVVMVPFPHAGTYTIGFVTHEAKIGLIAERPEKKLSVFVPTTPNPTSGFLLFFAEEETLPVSMTVEEALKWVISVGIVNPQSK